MQVPNRTRPGVKGSKRPALASRTRYKNLYKISRNLVIRSTSVIRFSSVIGSRVSIVSDQWRVSLHKVMPQNRM